MPVTKNDILAPVDVKRAGGDLNGITVGGEPLAPRIEILSPLSDEVIAHAAEIRQHQLYHPTAIRWEQKGDHGPVKTYTEDEKFEYLVARIGGRVEAAWRCIGSGRKSKILRLFRITRQLPATFTMKDLAGKIVASADRTLFVQTLANAGLVKKKKLNRKTLSMTKTGEGDEWLASKLILNAERLVTGYVPDAAVETPVVATAAELIREYAPGAVVGTLIPVMAAETPTETPTLATAAVTLIPVMAAETPASESGIVELTGTGTWLIDTFAKRIDGFLTAFPRSNHLTALKQILAADANEEEKQQCEATVTPNQTGR